jgi:hypothetical protein
MPRFHVHNRKAFTIVELLVSTAVLALLVSLLGTMTSNVSNVWTKGNAEIDRRRNARAIVDLVSSDLRGALLPVDPAVEPTKPNLQFALNPGGISVDYKNPDALFWQAPVATDQSRGDIAEVGYFVKWDMETSPDNPRARLCRFFVNPSDTANFRIYSDRDKWLENKIIESVAPANNQADGSGQLAGWRGLVADDVIGFWARWKDGANNQVKTYDSRVTRTLPKVVEISIVQLDAKAAIRVTPLLQTRLAEMVGQSTDANHFLKQFQGHPEFKALYGGARAMTSSVRLENAR